MCNEYSEYYDVIRQLPVLKDHCVVVVAMVAAGKHVFSLSRGLASLCIDDVIRARRNETKWRHVDLASL